MSTGRSSSKSGSTGSRELVIEDASRNPGEGMSYQTAAFFLVAQMAGAGFLALPQALSNTGWVGVPMLPLFAVTVAFSGTRLGQCWVILEERWEEYKKPSRQPYMEIAFRAFGKIGRSVNIVAILITLIGSTIVYSILIAQFLNALIVEVSLCEFATIIMVVFIPFTWLGTPKDFWQASVAAVIATIIACVVIFVQLLVDADTFPEATYANPSFKSFSLGFGTILFSFGGASVFPTIQNDMNDRSQFWKSVVISFITLLIMYAPVAITGYVLLGESVPGNILLYTSSDLLPTAVKIAIGFEIINLIGTYLIAFNPIAQTMEEMVNIPPNFNWKRVVLRTSLVIFELIIALALPDFGLILNLVGGSTVAMCSFWFPPMMYMRLVDDKSNPDWPERTISFGQRLLLWGIAIVAVVGGVSSTGSAIYGIINSDFDQSCFVNYT